MCCMRSSKISPFTTQGGPRAGERIYGLVWNEPISVAGPMPVKSAGGCEYLYVVVDYCTQTVYAWPMRLVSEAAEAFRMFENELGARLHAVMTDNAWELSMGEMRETCEKEGIQLNITVPYHPVLNRVAECVVGVLTDAVHAMLHDSGLLQYLWAEAYNMATYVHNRTPTRALGDLPI